MIKNLAFIKIPNEPKEYHLLRFREETKALNVNLVEIDPLETRIIFEKNTVHLLDKNNKPFPPCDAVFRKVIFNQSAEIIQQVLTNSGAHSLFTKKYRSEPGKIPLYVKFSQNNIPFPKTFILSTQEQLESCLQFFNYKFPLVAKMSQPTTHGIGTILIGSKLSLKSVIEYMFATSRFTRYPEPILVQEFIKESQGRDIRTIVLNNQVIAAVERDNSKKDFRANVFQGAQVKKTILNNQQKEIAIKAVNSLGLKFGGVDIMFGKNGPLLTEVNSPCDYSFVEQKTGVNITKKIIQALHFASECHGF